MTVQETSLESSLTGLWTDLTHLSNASSTPSDSAQAMVRYLSDKQLSVTDFIGVIVSAPSEEAVDVACKCVVIVCRVLGLQNMHESGLIADGLTHPEPRVQNLVLELLLDASTPKELRLHHLPQIIETLATPSTIVSKHATTLLLQIATSTATVPASSNQQGTPFFTPETVSQFTYFLQQNATQSDQTISLRVSDLLIKIASQSPILFEATEATGLLDTLIKEPLNSKDIMTKLNTIEILSGLLFPPAPPPANVVVSAATAAAAAAAAAGVGDDDDNNIAGFQFLEKSGVFSCIKAFMAPKQKSLDIEARLLQVSAIGFYARLSVSMADSLVVLEDAYGYCETISKILVTDWRGDDDDDDRVVSAEVKEACLLAIGNVASSARNGLVSLLETRFPDVLQVLGEMVVGSHQGRLKVVATQSLSCVFDNDVGDGDEQVSAICGRLFDQVGGYSGILNMMKSYDEELRVAGYACLKGVCKYSWGLTGLREAGQFINFVLDRATETSQLGMKWRFSVAESIARDSKARQLLPPVVFERFLKFAKEGPFYVEAQPQVAMSSM
ncbi:proteasome non-ATPase 26S subunit-domain-containing protein [Obelidium mucronatum]|nr:proteasome non-ATPase 26S subunit-domain-containing protein [Obelidium mucronatum]